MLRHTLQPRDPPLDPRLRGMTTVGTKSGSRVRSDLAGQSVIRGAPLGLKWPDDLIRHKEPDYLSRLGEGADRDFEGALYCFDSGRSGW